MESPGNEVLVRERRFRGAKAQSAKDSHAFVAGRILILFGSGAKSSRQATNSQIIAKRIVEPLMITRRLGIAAGRRLFERFRNSLRRRSKKHDAYSQRTKSACNASKTSNLLTCYASS